MKTRLMACAATAAILALALSGACQQSAEQLYKAGLYAEEVGGDLQKAIATYQDLLKRFPDNREVAAKAQLHIGLCHEKLGTKEAEKAFQRVINDFPEQVEEVKAAKEKLSAILQARSVFGAAGKGLSVRLIWSGPEADTASHASPDGRFLSFIDEESGNLCIKELASGKQGVLVSRDQPGKPFEFPLTSRWSPDGKKLTYGWFNRDNSIELRMVGTDGSNIRTLYRQKNEMAFPVAWSPDSKSIAINLMRDFYKSYNVGLISAEDGSLRILKTVKLLGTVPKNMTFSRDGRFVMIDLPQKDNDPRHDIFALSVDGAQEFRLTEHPSEDSVLGWIPGSDALLFLSDRTGTHDAWMVEVADGRPLGEPRLVRKNLGQVSPLGISLEGSFFYSLGTTMWDVFTASVDLEKRAVIEPPKITAQPLVGANHQPQWSPDGRYLAFISDRKGETGERGRMALWVRSADTGEMREIITDLKVLYRPCWAPDGRSIFVLGPALYQIDVQTGRSTLLVGNEPGAAIKFIAPAADGKSIYYTNFEFANKRARIMGVDLSTRETRELYRQEAPPDIGGLSVSPDGKQLLFGTLALDESLVLKAIPLPGGPPREILKSKASGFGFSTDFRGGFCWTPDGKRILFFREVLSGKGKKSELSSVPAEGGEIEGLGLVVEGSPDVFSLHPDGRRLAFSASQPGAEVWVMENFLPAKKK